MKKVAIYTRLSDEDKDKRNKTDDSESIQNQKSMLISHALEKGWEIYNIYSDEDYSGSGVNRPDFQKMIKDCENGKIDIVLCKSQSRFSRELEVIEHYIHNKFLEWKIRFISLVDNADTEVAGNKKARQINGLINEWYLEDLSDNIRKTLKHKREKGEFVGSFAPYGYKKNPDNKHQLIIDDIPANIIRLIFEMYANGRGYRAIAIHLNNQGILSPIEYKKQTGSNFICSTAKDKTLWTTDTIRNMLKNETYIGSLVQGKKTYVSHKNKKPVKISKRDWVIIKDCHEPIIDIETWSTVSSLFKGRAKALKNGDIHTLGGKVYCKECETVFTKNNAKSGGKEVSYLLCKNIRRTGACENNSSIRLDYLEKVILDEINIIIKKYSDLSKLKYTLELTDNTTKIADERKLSLEKEREQIKKNIEDKKNLYKPMYEDKLKGIITEEEFISLRETFHDELKSLEKRILSIEKELEKEISKTRENASILELIKKYENINELSRVVVDEFIEKIYIGIKNKQTKERYIYIEWKI
ncbi:MAG: recombinase family protein [Defluviitaleaceae bacterium]|nr:recombinase family protein [Defluviitaleaceae bacterium]